MKTEILPKIKHLFSDELTKKLIQLRRNLHQNPELSFKEERTAQVLFDQLSELNPKEIKRVACTGLVARIGGKNPNAPVVAIRGDIDALPIHEETGLDYTSKNAGVMHACGHDVHATWAIGTAHLLSQNPAAGDVLVVLQPAEEIGQGARAILASGALDNVQAMFGGHVDRRFKVGQVVAQTGALAASSDKFQICLTGKGAHGARPHESRDPIVGAAALIMQLQTIISRRLNPADAGVVTVGTVNAGTAFNIIPETASLTGTIRATTKSNRDLLKSEVERLSLAIAQTHQLKVNFEMGLGTPPIENPPDATKQAQQAVKSLLGEEALQPLGFLNMGGEDFACYLEKMPGCFLRIGAREEGSEIIPAHSPYFYADEGCIFVGAAVLAETARIASESLFQTK